MSRQSMQIWKNEHRSELYDIELQQILNRERAIAVMAELSSWPGYEPTPLRWLPGLSRAVGVAQIGYKDEATRFGLGSFKALGGAYAVMRQVVQYLQEVTGDPDISLEDVRSGRYREKISDLVVTTATDGNHGRSVAWGAQQVGCTCVIFIHEGVSEERERAIAQFGARVERIPGNYDSSVRWADAQAAANGWVLLADTSYPGYSEIPCDVMQGYTVMAEEALQQWQRRWGNAPTHVFVQAGVGGLAAAICAHFWETLGDRRPTFLVVEPENAACLYETARQDCLLDISGNLDTLMGCLSAGRASLLAWDILRAGADFFVTIPDAAAAATMRVLAQGTGSDRPIVAGESGVAGMAALLSIAKQSGLRSQIQLEADSRILLFGTEGAMDPKSYAQIVGKAPANVVGVE